MNAFGRPLEMVAFDADDTLWHSENLFADAHQRYEELLYPYADPELVRRRVLDVEAANLRIFGYGVKGFTLSLIETAIELTEGRITAAEIASIVGLGKDLLDHPVELIDGAGEVVERVTRAGLRTVIVTKGDLFHQESKVARSGLGEMVESVEILAEKNASTYRRVFRRLGADPTEVLMVGNSVRSDVLPIVELGGSAVHVPYHYLWEHEHVPDAAPHSHGYHQVSSIREVLDLIGLT